MVIAIELAPGCRGQFGNAGCDPLIILQPRCVLWIALVPSIYIRGVQRHAFSDALGELLMLDVLEDAHDNCIAPYVVVIVLFAPT